MGFWQSLLDLFGLGGRKANVLVVGLDNSGKSTIIERLKPKAQQAAEVAPTVGFNIDEVQSGNVKFTVFDMSGAGRYRTLWEQYYKDAQAVIYVIDSADRLRLVVAKDEMDTMLKSPLLPKNTPVLFYANKMDLPTSLAPAEIAQVLELEQIKEHPWQIMPSNALTGEGLEMGAQWLSQQVSR